MTSELQKALNDIVSSLKKEVKVKYESVSLDGARALAAALSGSARVTTLCLRGCNLGAQQVQAVAQVLWSNTVLTELELWDNEDVSHDGAQAVADMLKVNATLKTLWMYACGIGDVGASHLAGALRVNETLTELDVADNGITQMGASELAAALRVKKTLRKLSLNDNPLGDDGVKAVAVAVPQSGLKMLQIRDCHMAYRGATALCEMLKSGARLRELWVDELESASAPLEDGFRSSGWLTLCLHSAALQYIHRNDAMHQRARDLVVLLLVIRKRRRTLLSLLPKEVVREIAEMIYSTRGELEIWNV